MKRTILPAVFLLSAALAACAPQNGGTAAAGKGHPPLSEQDQLVACADCHRKATPEIAREWFDSSHGVAMVKCYQCHGTFEGLRTTPSLDACAICHSGQFEHAGGKKCWECHPSHGFKARS